MSSRGQHKAFFAAAVGLWLLFFIQAVNTPVLLDDWFQLRYWRDHDFGPSSLWTYARFNYFNYNPRFGEVLLAIVNGSQAIHLIVTPLVQLAVLPTVFVIAFARWPRPTLRDLQLLLFIQTMIWLVIPIPGIMYFYRPFATNYLWAFTITLALFVPYRLALAGACTRPRWWPVPVMLVLGWVAGMCNEHTGPTAMLAMAGLVCVAWRRQQLRAWMLAGMIGLYIGYPMLFFAPGQSVRYGGIAAHYTPTRLLADRGIIGCLEIFRDFIVEARLALLFFVAAVVRYLWRLYLRGGRFAPPSPRTVVDAIVLAAASAAIVMTLCMSPMASDRVFYASGVLLVAALTIAAQHLFHEPVVRRFVISACVAVCAFHAVRFVATYAELKAENDARLAILAAAPPGSVVHLPSYKLAERSRWSYGDDFAQPWLRDYVVAELYDVAHVELDHAAAHDEIAPLPTYRELQTLTGRFLLATEIGRRNGIARFTVHARQVFDDPQHRPMIVIAWTPQGYVFVDGRPYDDSRGHFIRVSAATVPPRLEATYMIGCGDVYNVDAFTDGAHVLVPVDERRCRGPFTAIMCEPDRCWVAGWY